MFWDVLRYYGTCFDFLGHFWMFWIFFLCFGTILDFWDVLRCFGICLTFILSYRTFCNVIRHIGMCLVVLGGFVYVFGRFLAVSACFENSLDVLKKN